MRVNLTHDRRGEGVGGRLATSSSIIGSTHEFDELDDNENNENNNDDDDDDDEANYIEQSSSDNTNTNDNDEYNTNTTTTTTSEQEYRVVGKLNNLTLTTSNLTTTTTTTPIRSSNRTTRPSNNKTLPGVVIIDTSLKSSKSKASTTTFSAEPLFAAHSLPPLADYVFKIRLLTEENVQLSEFELNVSCKRMSSSTNSMNGNMIGKIDLPPYRI